MIRPLAPGRDRPELGELSSSSEAGPVPGGEAFAAAAAMRAITDPGDRAQVAAALHGYADQVTAGQAPVPALSVVDGLTVVPRAVHDVLCDWRVASRQDTDPPVSYCSGCRLAYSLSPQESSRDW